jgi:hypothetical protein
MTKVIFTGGAGFIDKSEAMISLFHETLILIQLFT